MENNLNLNERNFDKEFQFLYSVCLKSKYKVWLGKKLLEGGVAFQLGDNLRIIMIDALFHSAAVDMCKIVSNKNDITIKKFVNTWLDKSSTEQKDMLKKNKLDETDLNALIKRRNKELAHAGKESLNENISVLYPLRIDTLERIINNVEKRLQIVYGNRDGSLFRTIKQGDTEFANQLELKLNLEFAQIKNVANLYDKMFKFLREKFPNDLCKMMYSPEKRKGEWEKK